MKKFALLLTAVLLLISATGTVNHIKAEATSAQSMITIENSTNRVLAEKNAHIRLPMASTTKIVTAITVIDNCDDLQKEITVPDKAVGIEGSSIYLEKGEKLKIIDLLYGLMLQSGNDCAEALAILIGGNRENFAAMMNETARKVGVNNSNFVTPHGLHDDNHYTTAYDLAMITSYAMKNPIFAEIVATKRYTMTWQGRNYNRVILNKNKILSNFDGGDGVKTGFTKKAGRCLVSSATRNGMRVICVVLNCGPMFEDCAALMDQAFNEYELTPLVPENYIAGMCTVKDGRKTEVEAGSNAQFYYPLKSGEKDKIKLEYELNELVAPVKIGAEAGKFSLYIDKQLLFSEKLYTINGVEPYNIWDRAEQLIHDWVK